MGKGETKIEGVTWEISESVSPKGTHVTLHLTDSKYGGSAWIYMDARQTHELSNVLKRAANWCDDHV